MSLTVAQAYRYCDKCMCLFRAGEFSAPGTPKGICPAGDAHRAEGLRFEIPANGPPSATAQHQWRSCGFCFVMFYNGFASRGVCDAGGEHAPEGFNYVLPHR